jgi:orotate phosphoribosyltransferase
MTNEDVLAEFRDAGALREGRFVLSSGLRSPVFLQKNLVSMRPDRTADALPLDLASIPLEEPGRRRLAQ